MLVMFLAILPRTGSLLQARSLWWITRLPAVQLVWFALIQNHGEVFRESQSWRWKTAAPDNHWRFHAPVVLPDKFANIAISSGTK
jgi:hypothetical protein